MASAAGRAAQAVAQHYKVLGVSRGAGRAAIRAAYLEKAKQFHPDINKSPLAEKRFKEVQEAYLVLKDEGRRKLFDGALDEAARAAAAGGGAAGGAGGAASAAGAAAAGAASAGGGPPRRSFRGAAYDPSKERTAFAKEFYAQTEALRREMELDQASTNFGEYARAAAARGLRRMLPALALAAAAALAWRAYKKERARRQRPTHRVLRNMHGEAFVIDEYGRRMRAPRFDDKARRRRAEPAPASYGAQLAARAAAAARGAAAAAAAAEAVDGVDARHRKLTIATPPAAAAAVG